MSVRRPEWRANWTLVVACALGFSFSSLLTNAFGFFIQPISQEFHWSRTQASLGITINAVVSVLLSPVAGMAVARWGVRKVSIPGLFLLSLTIAAFSLANGSRTQWLLLWLAYALVDLSVKSTVWTTAIAQNFRAERSLALGAALSGASFALIVSPPLTAALIDRAGWRGAFVALGLGWGALAFAAVIFFLKEKGSDAARATAADPGSSSNTTTTLTLREVFSSIPVVLIALSTLLALLFSIAIQVHQAPILMANGMTMQRAASVMSIAGVAGIAGKLVTGWLMDRMPPGIVAAATLMITAAAYLLLMGRYNVAGVQFCAVLMVGYTAATEFQICAYLTSRYAGVDKFAIVFAFMSSIISLGAGLGPLLAGYVFDKYGSYDPLMLVSAGGTALAALMLLALERFSPFEGRPDRLRSSAELPVSA